MKICGIILQVLAIASALFGILIGVLNLIVSPFSGGSGLILIISAVIGGVVLFGVGASFRALAVITDNSTRTANAMEFLARRRPKVRTQPGVYPTPTQEIPPPPTR